MALKDWEQAVVDIARAMYTSDCWYDVYLALITSKGEILNSELKKLHGKIETNRFYEYKDPRTLDILFQTELITLSAPLRNVQKLQYYRNDFYGPDTESTAYLFDYDQMPEAVHPIVGCHAKVNYPLLELYKSKIEDLINKNGSPWYDYDSETTTIRIYPKGSKQKIVAHTFFKRNEKPSTQALLFELVFNLWKKNNCEVLLLEKSDLYRQFQTTHENLPLKSFQSTVTNLRNSLKEVFRAQVIALEPVKKSGVTYYEFTFKESL